VGTYLAQDVIARLKTTDASVSRVSDRGPAAPRWAGLPSSRPWWLGRHSSSRRSPLC